MSLVVFTALVGMVAAPARSIRCLPRSALLAIAAGAGASGALNMWYDADIDGMMRRTRGRPIPAGRISETRRSASASCSPPSRSTILGLAANWLAAALLAFTIFFYVVIYTMWLKRRTAQNIVIGGAAGALPPVIGWAADDRRCLARAARLFPHHLHVDAAAFLGARALHQRATTRAPAFR